VTSHAATSGLPFATAPLFRRSAARRLQARPDSCAPSSVQARGRAGGLRPNQELIRCRLLHGSRSPRSTIRTPRVHRLPPARVPQGFPCLARPSKRRDRSSGRSNEFLSRLYDGLLAMCYSKSYNIQLISGCCCIVQQMHCAASKPESDDARGPHSISLPQSGSATHSLNDCTAAVSGSAEQPSAIG
jgi:hypothetical protein